MAVEVTRLDRSAQNLRKLARLSSDTYQARRLLALAAILDRAWRCDAAKMAGMDRQTLRDWVTAIARKRRMDCGTGRARAATSRLAETSPTFQGWELPIFDPSHPNVTGSPMPGPTEAEHFAVLALASTRGIEGKMMAGTNAPCAQQHAASLEPKKSWLDRSELASLFIREGDTVCDLGCGAQGLKRFLPEKAGYIPVDRNNTVPGTFLCDLNAEDFELPPLDFNVIVALGLLNYLNDIEKFMTRLAGLCPGKLIIFTYDFWKINTDDMNQPIRNSFKELEEGSSFFSRHVRNLTAAAVFRRRAMFTGNLGPGTADQLIRASATKLACRYIRPQEYLAVKLFDLEMMPRWLA